MEKKLPDKFRIEKIKKLNEVDWNILILLTHCEKISVGGMVKILNIAPVNNWKHMKKLQKIGLVNIPNVKKGKRKYITINKNYDLNDGAYKHFNGLLKAMKNTTKLFFVVPRMKIPINLKKSMFLK